jgi:SNF2 family DNA or RNA helicase
LTEPIDAFSPDDLSCPLETENENPIEVHATDLNFTLQVKSHPQFDRPWKLTVKQAALLNAAPWVRSLGKLGMEVSTQTWKFPTPGEVILPARPKLFNPDEEQAAQPSLEDDAIFEREDQVELSPQEVKPKTRLKPPTEMVQFKDRLLYLLQPPLEDLFAGRQITLPFKPFPYQVKGIAFLMPRHAALIADEMGLGKTAQVIIALRLMFHSGMIQKALVVCPKPLVVNWSRELRLWAEDVPFEVVAGDTQTRRHIWFESKCPLKLVNYEILTRDEDWVGDDRIRFDVVALDEAQRIKNKDSKTAKVVRSLHRDRSWAMTGTPIENRVDDLINIFSFVDPDRIPPETPARMLPSLTQDSIIRRVKEDVVSDMPPRIYRDAHLELTPAQREAYDMAEKDGVVHLNELGDTISVQHVFELVMRLKQICNFDPRTGDSAKLEQILADMEEVAANNRKAIIFSQWVEPLEHLAEALAPFGPLQYHGKIPHKHRQPILDRFKSDPTKHVILMSYGTGSVGLNLQFTNYVFLFDRWWNPAIEDQAINRAHRLGQKDPVFVVRFISQNTIENRIADILEKKRQLFNDLIAQNGPPPSLGLDEDDIFGLFDVKARPKRAAA